MVISISCGYLLLLGIATIAPGGANAVADSLLAEVLL